MTKVSVFGELENGKKKIIQFKHYLAPNLNQGFDLAKPYLSPNEYEEIILLKRNYEFHLDLMACKYHDGRVVLCLGDWNDGFLG